MVTKLFKNALIINEGKMKRGHVVIKNDLIDQVLDEQSTLPPANITMDCKGLLLIPGVIDDQVHFREPGLTHKGNIGS